MPSISEKPSLNDTHTLKYSVSSTVNPNVTKTTVGVVTVGVVGILAAGIIIFCVWCNFKRMTLSDSSRPASYFQPVRQTHLDGLNSEKTGTGSTYLTTTGKSMFGPLGAKLSSSIHRPESVFNPTLSSFPSSSQHLT